MTFVLRAANFDHQVLDPRLLVSAVRGFHASVATPIGGFPACFATVQACCA